MVNLNRKISSSVTLSTIKNVVFVLVGCLILAFADAAFLTPCNIVSGGVLSIGIIVNYYLEPAINFDCTDIIVATVQIILWLIGLLTLGKKFSLNTLIASFSYAGFYALLHRFNIGNVLGIEAALYPNPEHIETAELILCGIFGGALAGTGVAVAYLGNGSTGGFDIVSFIIAKYSEMKQDVSGFIIDASLIIIGIICMKNIELGLIGILAALACAIAVQYIYVNADTFVIVDIISDNYKEIQDYIHCSMNHGTTIIETTGGYTGQKHEMIRAIIYQVETSELRNKIAQIDPKAFVSFTQAKTINGEGFSPFVIPKHNGFLRRRGSDMAYQDQQLENDKSSQKSNKHTQENDGE